jgi:hypothetical protein
MRTFYVIALFICVLFGVSLWLTWREYLVAWEQFIFELSSKNYNGESDDLMRRLSFICGSITILFISFCSILFSFTLKLRSTKTSNVISIIALSFCGLVFLASLLPVFDPGGVSVPEFIFVPGLYLLFMTAFSMVNLIQAFGNPKPLKANEDVLDDGI